MEGDDSAAEALLRLLLAHFEIDVVQRRILRRISTKSAKYSIMNRFKGKSSGYHERAPKLVNGYGERGSKLLSSQFLQALVFLELLRRPFVTEEPVDVLLRALRLRNRGSGGQS